MDDDALRLRIAPEYFERVLASEDASQALALLDSWWCARAGGAREASLSALSQAERDVHLVLVYLAEVGNGGHVQFFLNPGGAGVAALRDSLGRIGLPELQAILTEAINVFPGGVVAADAEVRERAIESLPASSLERWGILDRRLCAADSPALGTMLTFVRAHTESVLVVERS